MAHSLGALHFNYSSVDSSSSYIEARDYVIKYGENRPLLTGSSISSGIVDGGGDGNPTIGYGFNLAAWSVTQVRAGLTHALGGSLTASQERGMQLIEAWRNQTLVGGSYISASDIIGMSRGAVGTDQQKADIQSLALTDAQATVLLHDLLDGYSGVFAGFESSLSSALGGADVPQSLERIALLDNHYRGLLGDGLKDAVEGVGVDPASARAEAWFQIRYLHQGYTKPGQQNRQAASADLLNLLPTIVDLDGGSAEEAALNAVSYLYEVRYDIITQRDMNDSFPASIQSSKLLVEAYWSYGKSVEFIQKVSSSSDINLSEKVVGVSI